MVRTFALLFTLIWVLAAVAAPTEPEAYAPGEVDFSKTNPALTISSPSAEFTAISLAATNVVMLDSVLDSGTYQVFGIPGEPFVADEGVPAIPQVTRMYRIPNTGSVDLVIGETSFHLVDGVDPFPIQPDEESFRSVPVRKAEIYRSDAWYPSEVARISEPMIVRDFRVVSVTLYPVQVNPVTHQARVYDQLNVDVVANDSPGENELLHSRLPSGAFAPIYRNAISNLDDDALDDVTQTPGAILFLCRNNAAVLAWVDSMATWKKRRGYEVAVQARTSWTISQMRDSIRHAYNTWDPPLEFACIVGDARQSAFSMPTDGNSRYDHYFALMTDEDDLEDIGVGRIPANTETHLATFYSKLVGYERNPQMQTPGGVADTMWFHSAFLYASLNYNTRSNPLAMLWARRQFWRFTGINNVNVDTHYNNVDNNLIWQRLNAGVSFFLWRGANVGEMTVSSTTGMEAGFTLPVVMAITCGTGWFTEGPQQVSEAWCLAGTPSQPKGGICGIGSATYYTHVQYNNTVAGGLAYAICNQGIEHTGLALASAKVQLHLAYPDEDTWAGNFSSWNNLMGDPSLSMWTDQPDSIVATYPGTVNVGIRRIQPQVRYLVNGQPGNPVEGALVVLWKGTEVYAKGVTDAGGFVDIPVTVNSAGTMLLTVTKRNHRPFLADIACVPASRMVALSSFTVDDDNVGGTSGNLDGNFNPGEVIDLPTYLRNFGTSQTATNVSASLTSDNSRIQIVNGTQTFADMAPGDSALSVGSFRVAISPLMMQDERAIMTLEVTASGEQTFSSVAVVCRAGDGVFISGQVTGGDGDSRLEPNETVNLRVTVRNEGDISMPTVTGTLISNSSFIAVTQNQGTFGTINVNQQATNTNSPFEVRANTLVYPGHQASMMLLLTTNGGSVDTVTFTLPIGFVSSSDPTGPDDYGYYAYDDTDDSVEFHHEFAYVDITASGQNLNLNDPGEQSTNAPWFSAARALPFPFTYYGEPYDSITICSNGWAAFGTQTELDLFRNYPIPGQQAPDAMLAPFWDDLRTSGSGLGVWKLDDNANHRFIIQWKATGWAGSDGSTQQNFEIILLDPAFYPTRDGNGIIIFQYQDVTEMPGDYPQGVPDVLYSTVGIQAPGSLVGLQYRFNDTPEPGAASLVDGRSITFTTESRSAFGHITGQVVNAESLQPMFGVPVSIDGHNDLAVTDSSGSYTMADVLIGTYTVRAQYFGFNDGVAENVVVSMDSTVTLNFSLTHPEIALSTDSIVVHYPPDPLENSFRITNDGDGPLDYNISIEYNASGSLDDAWDYLTGINVTAATSDAMIQGCEFAGDYWWISGSGTQGQPMLYRFDLEGNYAGAIPQPSTGVGWFDLAYDGQYLYGSEQRTSGGGLISGVDLNGQVQTTIDCPVNPSRAIAYDPQTDHFWVADQTTDIYEISRDSVVAQYPVDNLLITGLAWNVSDPDGYKLYIFHRDPGYAANVTRMHPTSGDRQFLVQVEPQSGDYAAGCTVTGAWNSTLLVFGGIMMNPSGDRLGIWELTFNTTWITVTPMIANVPAHSWRDVSVVFDPTELRDYVYRVNLTVANNSADSALMLPVEFDVAVAADDAPEQLPTEYALYQNYPNPFNGTTTFRLDLKQGGRTSLKVYNLLGQEVATVMDQFMEAGRHSVNFGLDDLASGVYVYRIESGGNFVTSKKLVLLK